MIAFALQRMTMVHRGTDCRRFAVSLLLLGMTAGCQFQPPTGNPHVAPVSGVVTMNGEPLAGVTVLFESSEARSSEAVTDGQGRYVLNYDVVSPGARIGMHRVRISRTRSPESAGREFSKIPDHYNIQSKLRVQVRPGDNVFDFHLTDEVQPVPSDDPGQENESAANREVSK